MRDLLNIENLYLVKMHMDDHFKITLRGSYKTINEYIINQRLNWLIDVREYKIQKRELKKEETRI